MIKMNKIQIPNYKIIFGCEQKNILGIKEIQGYISQKVNGANESNGVNVHFTIQGEKKDTLIIKYWPFDYENRVINNLSEIAKQEIHFIIKDFEHEFSDSENREKIIKNLERQSEYLKRIRRIL